MQGNVLGQSGGSSSSGLNVYAQLAEPRNKDGVWIKTEEVVTDKIKYEKLADIPYVFYDGLAVAIDTNIYLFRYGFAYKYDVIMDEYTKLSNMPYNFYGGSGVAIGRYIYIYGNGGSTVDTMQYAYKYNTLTDEYTKLTNIPNRHKNGRSVAIGTDIYLFGGGMYTQDYTAAYKYNTLTNTYTNLTKIPFIFYGGAIATIENDIYLFGSYYDSSSDSNSRKYVYKYNILTDTYTKLNNRGYNFYNGVALTINNNIYLFGGGSTNYRKFVYRYNYLIDEYIKIEDIPYDFYNGSAVAIGTNIYLFGGEDSNYQKYAYKASILTLPEISKYKYDKVELKEDINNILEDTYIKNNKTIFVETKSTFITKLTKILQMGFSTANIYDNNQILDYPVYYGNGQEWIKIENN